MNRPAIRTRLAPPRLRGAAAVPPRRWWAGLKPIVCAGVVALVTPSAKAQSGQAAPIPPRLAGVVQADKARGLSAAARTALSRDGTVVVAGSEKHFFALYDRNQYQGIPHFVALDPLLHLFHRKFDALVMAVEQERARPALYGFAQKQSERALALLATPQGSSPAAAEALKWLAIYHAVPQALLRENQEPHLALDPRIAAAVENEVKQIRAARGQGASLVCPHGLSYSRFKPRGHYRSYALQGYLQALTFYAECGLDVQRPAELMRALDVVRLVQAAEPAERQMLTQVGSLLRAIAGPADEGDLEPDSLASRISTPLPSLPAPLPADVLARVQERLRALPPARLPTFTKKAGTAGDQERSFRLLALGTLPDNVVLQQVGQQLAPKGSSLPSVLDVLAALGSATARELRQPPLLPPVPLLGAPTSAPPSFYARWLALLAEVTRAPAPAERLPAFMRSPAFRTRLVRSAAGSYAELRHDTLLYVKQPLVMREGGHSQELPASRAAGYVEPRPDIYRRLRTLLGEAAALLPTDAAAQRTLAGRALEPELLALLDFLTMVAELELAEQPFPKAVDDRLRDIGSELEALTRGHADRLPDQALVADILTVVDDGGPERALHVGIGNVDELWVVVPRSGKLLLTRGGVFSYYEFLAGPDERLDDTQWSERLDAGPLPSRPQWSRPLDENRIKPRRPLHKD